MPAWRESFSMFQGKDPDQVDLGSLRLPPGYEQRSHNGKPFYINHATKATQWNDPRTAHYKQIFEDYRAYKRNKVETIELRNMCKDCKIQPVIDSGLYCTGCQIFYDHQATKKKSTPNSTENLSSPTYLTKISMLPSQHGPTVSSRPTSTGPVLSARATANSRNSTSTQQTAASKSSRAPSAQPKSKPRSQTPEATSAQSSASRQAEAAARSRTPESGAVGAARSRTPGSSAVGAAQNLTGRHESGGACVLALGPDPANRKGVDGCLALGPGGIARGPNPALRLQRQQ